MKTLMFYEQLVPLNRDTHKRLRVHPANGQFAYSATTNSVPLAGIEFSDAGRSFPIVFATVGDKPGLPLALLGMRQDENLFVDSQGNWGADYVPAFVRRYPFVLQDQDGGDFTVLIDEAYAGFSGEDAEGGEPLFLDDGTQAPILTQTIDFLRNFQAEVERTRQFVNRLDEQRLLVPKVIQVQLPGQPPFVMQGLSAVDEQKLLALPDEHLLALARCGDLGWIYMHLASLGAVPALLRRLQEKIAG